MSTPIEIHIDGELTFRGELTDPTVVAALPIEGPIQRFGNEVSVVRALDIAVDDGDSNEVPIGAIAYWPAGECLTFFVAATPLTEKSDSDLVVATSAVRVVGVIQEPAPISRDARRIEVRR